MSDTEINMESNLEANITAASADIVSAAVKNTSTPSTNLKDDGDSLGSLAALPIDHLICSPIIAVANGQAELCKVYLDNLFRIAFKKGDKGTEVNSISFTLPRTIVSPEGDVQEVEMQVEAPLLSLIPVPAFTMDEATVRFSMEIKDVLSTKDSSSSEVITDAGFSKWGFHANITGKVSTTRENTRTSDKTAKYEIYARAVQHEPAEGMAKLTSLFASIIEPIQTGGGK